MQDRPTAPELLDAVREFIATELLPTLGDERLRFRARVAANLLDMLQRERALGPALLRAQSQRLAALLGNAHGRPAKGHDKEHDPATAVLAQQRILRDLIRADRAPPGTLAAVTDAVRGKLTIANPRYLAGFESL